LAEFGSPGDDVGQLIDGPFADPAMREDFQTRALRRTVSRLADRSPFYARRLAQAGVDARRLTLGQLAEIPVTRKADLVDHQQDFLCRGSVPYLSTRTTGTTGQPAEVWLSRYEADLWPALAGLSGLLRGEIAPTDCMQINISSRATAAVQQNVTLCRLVGARAKMLGVVPPEVSLEGLTTGDRAPTLLATYPSYLAQLLNAARRRGLGAADFRLRRIDVGGEVLTPALAAAAREVFGAPIINDTFAMTEVLPVSGRTCDQGHLHHDVNMGLVEIVDLDNGLPARPGQLGTVVITPFYPYRECMPVLRYDTRDVVRRLPELPLTCDLAGVPGSSAVLGKADQLLHVDTAVVTPRDLIEVYEALPTRPWPARFAAATVNGRIQLTIPRPAADGMTASEIARRFADRGIDIDLILQTGDPAVLRTVRADLLETTFAAAN
jgi:phenylacetate-coenzyme A ligase PaaK-like adenylate-forming protein